MAIEANTFLSYSAIGIREDLSDLIADISPTTTPFSSNIGSRTAENTFYEWQTDALATASATPVIEGQDLLGNMTAVTPTARIGNYCQINIKDFIISGTEQRVRKAGRSSEIGYQAAKASKELKRNVETALLANSGAVAGDATTARVTGGLGAFLKTNVAKASDGTQPVWTTIPTDPRNDGTQRDFTETLLKTAMESCYTAGAEVSMLMVGAYNKQVASTFAGIAEQRFNVKGDAPTSIIGAADVYVSDFGNLAIVPNRFQRARDAWLIDPDECKQSTLRPYQVETLARTGDAQKRLVLIEQGLQVGNEAGCGGIVDLNTSA